MRPYTDAERETLPHVVMTMLFDLWMIDKTMMGLGGCNKEAYVRLTGD